MSAKRRNGNARARGTAPETGKSGRQKLSVSIPAEMAAWVQAEAERLSVSISFIFVDAVARARRQRAWGEYLAQAGEDDIVEADVNALREELRAGGVSV